MPTCGGFSLIEVVIALAILSIGMLGIAKLQLAAIKNNSTGNIVTQATHLAEIQVERLKNTNDILILNDLTEENLGPDEQTGGIYTRTTTITNPLGGDFSRQIEVRVQWRHMGRSRRVVLRAMTQGNGI
jgi:type IV pilus assembly protein PilV